MSLIETNVKVSTKFLTESAAPAEKENWKMTYVTYLKITGKSPEDAKTERPKLTTLLPILQSLDQKWKNVKSE